MEGPGYLAVCIQPGSNTDEAAFHEWYNTEHGTWHELPSHVTESLEHVQ